MKKISIFLVLCFLTISVFSQKIGTELINQSFSSTTLPVGWTIDAQASHWAVKTTANAGGQAPELRFTYSPVFTGTSRFISPAIDLTGVTKLRIKFKHSIDHYASVYTVGVATRSGSTGTWNNVWTKAGANVTEEVSVDVTTADLGSADFQICFYFNGYSDNINNWYVDDILLFIPNQDDAMISNIGVTPFLPQGNVDITATISNAGVTEITSADVFYKIDDGTTYTKNLTGLSIAGGATYDFTFDDIWAAIPGNYDLSVWVDNINGGGNDDDITNDLLVKPISIATQTRTNFPMFESFTSSTCAPCASFNGSFFNTFLSTNETDLAIVKYQMNWPGSGDIYYTAEGGVRRTYYGVNAVPQLFIGGSSVATSAGAVNSAFASAKTKLAFFDLSAEFVVNENIVTVNIDAMPYVTASNFTIQTAVVEKITTQNTGNNGETSFHYVMMKMLPDAAGTTANFVSEVAYNLSLTQDLTGTNIEEFTDLSVVVFIQNNITKEIFQATVATPASLLVNSNLTNGATNIAVDNNIVLTFSNAIRLIDNSEITNENVSSFVTLTDAAKTLVPFAATINMDKTEITINPDNNLSYNTLYTLNIADASIETLSDIEFAGFTTSFTTELNNYISDAYNNIKIYPNPAKNNLVIEGIENTEIEIYNLLGVKILTTTENIINVSAIPTGNYILKIKANKNIITKNIVILH